MLNLGIETTDKKSMIEIPARNLLVHLQLRVYANQFEKRKAMEREEAQRAAKKAAELTRPDGGNQRP